MASPPREVTATDAPPSLPEILVPLANYHTLSPDGSARLYSAMHAWCRVREVMARDATRCHVECHVMPRDATRCRVREVMTCDATRCHVECHVMPRDAT